MTEREYGKIVKEMSPKSPMWKDCAGAFVIGGLICTVGQGVNTVGKQVLLLSEKDASAFTAIVMVFFGALLTGLGVYDKMANYAGAGTLVPITGFANAVASPALEFKTEGFVTGTAVKMFSIAGPVIVYGASASVVYGFVYWICQMLK